MYRSSLHFHIFTSHFHKSQGTTQHLQSGLGAPCCLCTWTNRSLVLQVQGLAHRICSHQEQWGSKAQLHSQQGGLPALAALPSPLCLCPGSNPGRGCPLRPSRRQACRADCQGPCRARRSRCPAFTRICVAHLKRSNACWSRWGPSVANIYSSGRLYSRECCTHSTQSAPLATTQHWETWEHRGFNTVWTSKCSRRSRAGRGCCWQQWQRPCRLATAAAAGRGSIRAAEANAAAPAGCPWDPSSGTGIQQAAV